MKLVAVVRAPTHPEEAARALASASGLALAEARMRLAPEPPAVLARLESDAADGLAATLRSAGLAALAASNRVPTDRDRSRARAFSLDDEGFTFTSRSGDAAQGQWADVLAVLRGLRAARSEVERVEKSTTFSLGTAVVTGGLKMTRTAAKTVRSSEESTEQVILVYLRDGRAVVVANREVDFSCLGRDMRPSSTANMIELARRLREKAKGA